MVTIKGFSLHIVMLSFFSLCGMEHADFDKIIDDRCVEDICNTIDRDHLGISENICFKSIMRAGLSWYKNKFLTYQKAIDEIDKIQNYIPVMNDEKHVLQKLVAQHWYVNYLMQALVYKKIYDFEDVTGSTIDRVCATENIAERIALSCAYKSFFCKPLRGKLTAMIPSVVSDIHFTVLYGPHGNLKPSSLAMSSDGIYLRATDCNNVDSVWNMETADLVDKSNLSEDTKWTCAYSYEDHYQYKNATFGMYCTFTERYRVTDKNDNYCAMVSNSCMPIDSEFFPVEVARNPKAIILFKRPKNVSYLCQKAFDNSYLKKEELRKLRDSETIKGIKGFPQKNLEKLINNRIEQSAHK